MKKYNKSLTIGFLCNFGRAMFYMTFFAAVPYFTIYNFTPDMALPLLSSPFLLFIEVVLFEELILSIFKREHVTFDGDYIFWRLEKMHVNSVKKVIFDMGSGERLHSRSPALYLIDNTETKMIIIKPSYRLIFNIKKICPNAKFRIHNWFSELLVFPLIAFIAGLIFSLIFKI